MRHTVKWYHATPTDNIDSILATGTILPGANGFLFLSNTPEDAGRFCLYHGHTEWAVFKIHRRDLEVTRLQANPAFKGMPIGFSQDFVTAMYDRPAIAGAYKIVQAEDIPNILPPGVEIVRDLKHTGTYRLGLQVTDHDAMLQHYFKHNPGEMKKAFRAKGMVLPDFLQGDEN